jgi:hypothetical protein
LPAKLDVATLSKTASAGEMRSKLLVNTQHCVDHKRPSFSKAWAENHSYLPR